MALMQLSSSMLRCQRQGWLRLGRQFTTADPETHDDFKPKYKGSQTDVTNRIESDVKGHDVFIYMKGTPEAPMCGFSNLAVRVLNAYGVRYGSCNVLEDQAVREGIKTYSNWPTIPQVFVKGDFVGGADILYSMHEEGELEKVLGPIVEKQEQETGKKQ